MCETQLYLLAWYRCCFRYTPLHRYTHVKYPVLVNRSKQASQFAFTSDPFANRFTICNARESVQSVFDFAVKMPFHIHACTMNCQFAIHRRMKLQWLLPKFIWVKISKCRLYYLRASYVETIKKQYKKKYNNEIDNIENNNNNNNKSMIFNSNSNSNNNKWDQIFNVTKSNCKKLLCNSRWFFEAKLVTVFCQAYKNYSPSFLREEIKPQTSITFASKCVIVFV